jgi:hypothetical protein
MPLASTLDTSHTTGAEQQNTRVTPAATRRVRYRSATFAICVIHLSPPFDAFAAAIVGKIRSGRERCVIC